MNYKYEKLKLRDCSNIIDSKNRGTLSVCFDGKPYSELVFYDTDCFCGCFIVYFNICKCGELIEKINNGSYASLLITRKCNNEIETVNLEGTLEILEEKEDCCCEKKKDCFKTVKLNIDKINGRIYYKKC
mgnify:CR=1 FL=1